MDVNEIKAIMEEIRLLRIEEKQTYADYAFLNEQANIKLARHLAINDKINILFDKTKVSENVQHLQK